MCRTFDDSDELQKIIMIMIIIIIFVLFDVIEALSLHITIYVKICKDNDRSSLKMLAKMVTIMRLINDMKVLKGH